MFDWLHQLSHLLETVLRAISDNYWLSIWFIFAVCVGEAVFILGLLVPSLPILLLTGGLIAQGALPFWEIYAAAVAGAVIGDAISYYIGWAFKDRIKSFWPFKNYLPLIDRGEVFFRHHGGKAIFIGRFITGVKAVVPGIAGMLNMPYRYFTLINVISAFVWAAAHILPGMLLTGWLRAIGLDLELVIIVGSTLLGLGFILIHYWKRIALALAPILGDYGKSLAMRWREEDAR